MATFVERHAGAGGVPGLESRHTMTYVNESPAMKKTIKEVELISDSLIASYRNVLLDSDVVNARKLFWGCTSVTEYSRMFLNSVLIGAYKVFDKSHLRYPILLEEIKRNNPEWVDNFVAEHERKCRRCKVEIFPLQEAEYE